MIPVDGDEQGIIANWQEADGAAEEGELNY